MPGRSPCPAARRSAPASPAPWCAIPELLLLDEPFASLDALTRLRMQALVSALWQRYRPAVLFVTHDVDEALLLADRALVLEGGRLRTELQIGLPRPRRHADPGFSELRRDLLLALGVDEARPDPLEAGPAFTPPGAGTGLCAAAAL